MSDDFFRRFRQMEIAEAASKLAEPLLARIDELEEENRTLKELTEQVRVPAQPFMLLKCDRCGTSRDYYVDKTCQSCGSGESRMK